MGINDRLQKNFDLSKANTVWRLKLGYTKVMHTQLMQRVCNLSVYTLYVPVNVFSVIWGRFSVFLYLNKRIKLNIKQRLR